MPTIGQLWDQYDYYTAELTKYSRQLAFANAAICWTLRSSGFTFPLLIYFSLLFVSLFFLLDVLHYGVGAICVRKFTQSAERKNQPSEKIRECEVHKPPHVDRWATWLAISKVVMLIFAFGFLISEFTCRILFDLFSHP